MGAGRIIAIIAGVLGIISVALFRVFPEIFSFWKLSGGGAGLYLGGFGTWSDAGDFSYAEDTLLTIILVIIVVGGVFGILGGIIENKAIGLIGGILMLLGPILLIVALFIEFGDFKDLADFIEFGTGNRFLLFGSGAGVTWGLWISTFLALGAGILGIIGGATTD